MEACTCVGVSVRRVRELAAEGCSLREVQRRTGLGGGCGECVGRAQRLIEAVQAQPVEAGAVPHAAAHAEGPAGLSPARA